ncbi:similar to mobilization protein MobD (plasmid) [Calothrix sp. PCC 7716]|nr:similar to mobilization protein MobD [Calothrix sp. PCC 7716]
MSQKNENHNYDKHEANHGNNACRKKRFVIVTGDKGGVGKSTFARGLFDYYIKNKLPCIGYDADTRNPQLERHFSPKLVRCVNIFERGGADRLLTDLEKDPFSLVLLDMPAQSGGYFAKFESEISFFSLLDELGYRVTMASVLNRVVDSVNVLNVLHQYCSTRVDYVVVKNLFYSADDETRFERYNEWEGRQKLIASGAIEIVMKDLFYKTYDFVDGYSISFSDALQHEKTSIIIKGRIKSWLAEFEKNIQLAPEYLGLNTKPMSDKEFEFTREIMLQEREKKKEIAKIEFSEKVVIESEQVEKKPEEHQSACV